jgi:hypothetical protein
MSAQTTLAGGVRELTDAEVATYRENGWVKLERFVSPELADQLLAGAKELMGEEPGAVDEREGHGGHKAVYESSVKRGGKVQDIGYWQDYHFPARDDGIEPHRSLVFSHEIGRAAQRLMARDVPIRYSSDLLACKMPAGRAGGGPTEWHQDYASAPVDRNGGLAFWIALVDVTAEMGTMQFLNGSHRAGCLGRTRVQGKGVTDYYPELRDRYALSEPLALKAGDATAHHNLVCHGAPENHTDRPRWGYIVAFFPGDVLFTGATHHNFDGLGLQINKELDHPSFPVIYP